jgi:hypothetical protein
LRNAAITMEMQGSPLSKAAIVVQVLSFAGSGAALFFRPVDTTWKEAYYLMVLDNQKKRVGDEHVHDRTCTSHVAVFASDARRKEARGAFFPMPSVLPKMAPRALMSGSAWRSSGSTWASSLTPLC